MIYIKDFEPYKDEEENTKLRESARFVIPYNIIEELISKQSEQAKVALEYPFSSNPNTYPEQEDEQK